MRFIMPFVLVLAIPAAGIAQPLSVSASVAVAWINPLGVPDYRGESPPSIGMVSHPTLVVLWRGQPGWAHTAQGRTGFGVRFESGPGGDELHAIIVEHGDIRLGSSSPTCRAGRPWSTGSPSSCRMGTT